MKTTAIKLSKRLLPALFVATCSPAWAAFTDVQFSTTGVGDGVTDGAAGGYDIVDINSFDWVDNFTTVIDDSITSSIGATTLNAFFAAAVTNDTLTFDLYSQSYLDGMTGSVPNPPTNLNTTYEVTSTITATETAIVTSSILEGDPLTTILFQSISGSYTFYYDTAVDANVQAGTGFDGGTSVPILSGTVTGFSSPSTFSTDAGGNGSGAAFLVNTVGSYDDAYLQADPASGRPLVGSTFDTFLTLNFLGSTPIDIGATIGELGSTLTVSADDLRIRSDATTQFMVSVPEPSMLLLVGTGLLLGGLARINKRQTRA